MNNINKDLQEKNTNGGKENVLNEVLQKRNCCGERMRNDAACNNPEFEAELKRFEQENVGLAEICFKGKRRAIYLYDLSMNLKMNDAAIVEMDAGIDNGIVQDTGRDALCKLKTLYKGALPQRKIIRLATEDDFDQIAKNNLEEPAAAELTRNLAKRLNLDMKVTESEWQYDRQRLTIYFTAPQRVDFRELVRELARSFRTRIELRQISSREEARRIGGIGACGMDVCCHSFLPDFNHVTLDHARAQQLANNASKLSGYCGRLKCCLLFEFEHYNSELYYYPLIHSKVLTESGDCIIQKIDIFKEIVFLHNISNGGYLTMTKEEINKYVEDNKVIPPENKYAEVESEIEIGILED